MARGWIKAIAEKLAPPWPLKPGRRLTVGSDSINGLALEFEASARAPT